MATVTPNPTALRSELYADPTGVFVHDAVLNACSRFGERIAVMDGDRRITYAQYGQGMQDVARSLVTAGVRPGDRVAILLPNSWEFAVAYHAATLAGAIPTPMNPSYKEREVLYQLQNSGAKLLISDGALIGNMNLGGAPDLQRVYTTRTAASGAESFDALLRGSSATLPKPEQPTDVTLAALPYSSGTTGLPKGVMLSHHNLVSNVYQLVGPNTAPVPDGLVALLFLPMYHIYGLNVVLNPYLMLGGTLVLMARFDAQRAVEYIARERVNYLPLVPPVLNILCQIAEAGAFPKEHSLLFVKSGAAPLAPELARRFENLTGIKITQGYGMTEASPVTHVGFEHGPLCRPESIGGPVAQTDCRILNALDQEVAPGEIGELVMRGPQFMLGYWNAPEATADVLRDGWYYSGDIARTDEDGLYHIVDRRKEMIKYKGLPVAPAEVESVLLECPLVKDAGVVAKTDNDAGEIPCAFIVLRQGVPETEKTQREICGFAAERLAGHKQPREIRFVPQIPRNPSGKVLRRELKNRV